MRPLFISFPLTHVYVGNGKKSGNTIHAIAKSGKSVFKGRERVIPGREMIGARGGWISDAKLPFHMNMRDIGRGRICRKNLL